MLPRTQRTGISNYFLFLSILAFCLSTNAFSQEKQMTLNANKSFQRYTSNKVDKVPVYPSCTGENNEMLETCMMGKISQFIVNNLNFKLASQLGLRGNQEITVHFVIDSTGKVANVSAKASHPDMEKEAIRVIKDLPDSQPAEKEGQKVSVYYTFPIAFEVE